VRYRNNSLFYRNEHGAYVGDVLTSLIETCRLNGINPIDCLSALLHHRSAVFAAPAAWLPWTYQQSLAVHATGSQGMSSSTACARARISWRRGRRRSRAS